jgi:virginiamycin B lyase
LGEGEQERFTGLTENTDGNVWGFSLGSGLVQGDKAAALKVTTSGVSTKYALPEKEAVSGPTAGAGSLWGWVEGHGIIKMSTAGETTYYTSGLRSEPFVRSLAFNGELWFSQDNAPYTVGYLSTLSWKVSEFSSGLKNEPAYVAVGPEKIWFTTEGAAAIGKVTGSTITEYSAGLNVGAIPRGLVEGPEGDMWFTDQGTTPAIGRITPSGTITEYTTGLPAGSVPTQITVGADGKLWFTDDGSTHAIGTVAPG